MSKQVHNRRKGKKKLAKARAKRSKSLGIKVQKKEGFRTLKPKPPSKKIMRMAARVRTECSKITLEERERLLKSALGRIK